MDGNNRRLWLVWTGILIALLLGAAGLCVLVAVLGFTWSRLPLFPPEAAALTQATASTVEATQVIIPTIAAPPPEVAPQSSLNRKAGIPEDIPVPMNVETGAFVGGGGDFSYLTDFDYSQMLAFYQQQLPKSGWVDVQFGTKIGRASAELNYAKDSRKLTVRITDVPDVGTVVEIIESE